MLQSFLKCCTINVIATSTNECFTAYLMFFPSTHRHTKLGHWDVIWVDTKTHTLPDVWGKAAGFRWTLTFLLSGAPGRKKERRFIYRCTCIHGFCNLIRIFPVPPVGTWEKENVMLFSKRVRHIYHISSLALHKLQYPVNRKPVSRGLEQWHLKQCLLYVWKWGQSFGKEVGPVIVMLP